MLFEMNKTRFLIIISLLLLEVFFLSLALRSYGNKYKFQASEYVMGIDNFTINDVQYKLSSDSGCYDIEGKETDSILNYDNELDKVVVKVTGSSHCELFYQKQ